MPDGWQPANGEPEDEKGKEKRRHRRKSVDTGDGSGRRHRSTKDAKETTDVPGSSGTEPKKVMSSTAVEEGEKKKQSRHRSRRRSLA